MVNCRQTERRTKSTAGSQRLLSHPVSWSNASRSSLITSNIASCSDKLRSGMKPPIPMPLAAAWVMRLMIRMDSFITGLSLVTKFCSNGKKGKLGRERPRSASGSAERKRANRLSHVRTYYSSPCERGPTQHAVVVVVRDYFTFQQDVFLAQGLREMNNNCRRIITYVSIDVGDQNVRRTATLTRGFFTAIGRENSLLIMGCSCTSDPWDNALRRSSKNTRHTKCRSMRLFNTFSLLALSNHVCLVLAGGAMKNTRGQLPLPCVTRMASTASAISLT